MGLIQDIIIPVNPDYSWELDPFAQLEYVNPVTLNNHEIRLANAAIRISQSVIGINKHIASLRSAMADTKAAIEDLEQELLSKNPAPSSTKTLKMLASYVRTLAFSNGQDEKYGLLLRTLRKDENELTKREIELDSLKFTWQTIKLTGEHIQTHLSFVKSEKANA